MRSGLIESDSQPPSGAATRASTHRSDKERVSCQVRRRETREIWLRVVVARGLPCGLDGDRAQTVLTAVKWRCRRIVPAGDMRAVLSHEPGVSGSPASSGCPRVADDLSRLKAVV